MTGACRVNEHRPLLAHLKQQPPRDVAITIRGDDALLFDDLDQQQQHQQRTSATASPTLLRYANGCRSTAPSLATVSPTYTALYEPQHQHYQHHAVQQQSRKFVVRTIDDVGGQKRSRKGASTKNTTSYGSIELEPASPGGTDGDNDDTDDDEPASNARTRALLRSLLCKFDVPRTSKRVALPPVGSNTMIDSDAAAAASPPTSATSHSETESDSDGTSSSNNATPQSILRIRDGLYACRTAKKRASVEFDLDLECGDDSNKQRSSLMTIATSCMPRRLTIEEKAALYRIRPDLQLTPLPILMRELDEIRRRRQRKLMFSILGGTLILLMVTIFYYMLTQTP